MKKSIVTLTMALVCGFAQAQTENGATDSAAAASGKPPHMARMKNNLDLTDEQVQKMREIRDSGGSMADMRAVLTPEQQAKAAGMRKEQKGSKGDRRAQMQKNLGLSDEQMEKMAEIRKAGGSREEMRGVLTPEQQTKFDATRSKHEAKGQPDHED
jgi:Spy/CpxP family protein refolding chaperone